MVTGQSYSSALMCCNTSQTLLLILPFQWICTITFLFLLCQAWSVTIRFWYRFRKYIFDEFIFPTIIWNFYFHQFTFWNCLKLNSQDNSPVCHTSSALIGCGEPTLMHGADTVCANGCMGLVLKQRLTLCIIQDQLEILELKTLHEKPCCLAGQ